MPNILSERVGPYFGPVQCRELSQLIQAERGYFSTTVVPIILGLTILELIQVASRLNSAPLLDLTRREAEIAIDILRSHPLAPAELLTYLDQT